ncbi:MAG: LacI family DNA-binding transcriptional regulator [Spirochaetales bacterium]|nr:LacI family DNA-binding transcriptional regulator [Spirochaetales bacterium]
MVTRKDVAEKAKVSPAVVSRVLNNSGYVAEEKRKRVLKVVKELGYSPNPVAVSLKNNRTKQILYFVKDLSNNYFREMYKGMAEYAARKNYIFMLAGYLEPDDLPMIMMDGMLFPTEDQVRKSIVDTLTVPYVAAGYGLPDADNETTTVYVDTRKAIDLGLEHLREQGHRKIAYACPSRKGLSDTRFRRFIEDCGFQPDTPYVLGSEEEMDSYHDVNHFELGIVAARQFLDSNLDATAILCFNDDMAIGLMSHLQKEGIRIPEELSVVGIDGLSEGNYTSPPLTSVSLEMDQHGRECARVLIGMIEGREKLEPVTITPRLIVRDSTWAV